MRAWRDTLSRWVYGLGRRCFHADGPGPDSVRSARCGEAVYDALTTTQRTLIVQLHQFGPVTATTSSDQAALVNRGLAQRLPVSGTTKLIVSSFGVTVAQYAYMQGVTP